MVLFQGAVGPMRHRSAARKRIPARTVKRMIVVSGRHVILLGDDATGQWTRTYGLAAPAKLAELIVGTLQPAG